jgi:hypothetical protein
MGEVCSTHGIKMEWAQNFVYITSWQETEAQVRQ